MITFSPFIILLFYYPCRIMCHQGFHLYLYMFSWSRTTRFFVWAARRTFPRMIYLSFSAVSSVQCFLTCTRQGISLTLVFLHIIKRRIAITPAELPVSDCPGRASALLVFARTLSTETFLFFFVWKTSRREVFFCSGAALLDFKAQSPKSCSWFIHALK